MFILFFNLYKRLFVCSCFAFIIKSKFKAQKNLLNCFSEKLFLLLNGNGQNYELLGAKLLLSSIIKKTQIKLTLLKGKNNKKSYFKFLIIF